MTLALLRVTAAIAGAPVAALLLLIALGDASPTPALLAAALITAVAAGLALVWTNDLRVLAGLLHGVGAGGGASPNHANRSFGPEVMSEVEALSQTMGERAALVDRLLRAEESIVERLPDPLIVLGPDRAVRRANAAARSAFGADTAAVLRHPGLRAAIDRALLPDNAGKPQTAELRVPVPVPREVQATVVGLDSPLSGGGTVLAVLSDRTRERAIERTRADFVANASHELRTPLASLTGFIDTLRGPAADDPPAQKRFLDIMAEQAARMNRLIDDLLSLSRIELSEHLPPDEQVDLAELTERMIASFEIRQRQRRMRFDWQPAEAVPKVIGDTDQLEQVVQNLLDNGLKYGREGGVVRVSLAAPGPGGRWPARPGVVLTIADDGPGIPRQHLPRLTERFYRVDTGRSRAVGGTGLGLAIVKHIVNRHRGQLMIESEEGKGASFSVWLPVV
jgi:two-component system phosphate regulon sensor histidine kinase PhoR